MFLSAHCLENSRKGVRGWKTWWIVMERRCKNFLGKVVCVCVYACVGGFVYLDMYMLRGVFCIVLFGVFSEYTAPTMHSTLVFI